MQTRLEVHCMSGVVSEVEIIQQQSKNYSSLESCMSWVRNLSK